MNSETIPTYEEAISSNPKTLISTGYDESKEQYVYQSPGELQSSELGLQLPTESQPSQPKADQVQQVEGQPISEKENQSGAELHIPAKNAAPVGCPCCGASKQGRPKLGTKYQNATPLENLGEHPVPVGCPSCGVREITVTEYKSGGVTLAVAAVLCIAFHAGILAFFFKSCKDVKHNCGHCGKPLARFHRSGRTEVLSR